MSLLANFGGIEQSSADLFKRQEAIETALTDLETQLNGMYQDWDGAAQQAYHTSQTEWSQSAGEMRTQLNIMAGLTSSSGAAYNAADQAAAKRNGG